MRFSFYAITKYILLITLFLEISLFWQKKYSNFGINYDNSAVVGFGIDAQFMAVITAGQFPS
jgi:hypothetical protein